MLSIYLLHELTLFLSPIPYRSQQQWRSVSPSQQQPQPQDIALPAVRHRGRARLHAGDGRHDRVLQGAQRGQGTRRSAEVRLSARPTGATGLADARGAGGGAAGR